MHTILALAAALSFGSPGAFTLPQAHAIAVHHEAKSNLGGHVQQCAWRDRHDVICVVTGSEAPIVGQPASSYRWEDVVTRSGACTNAGKIVKRVHGITYQNGGHHYGNCFTGPLVAMPVPGSLTLS